MINLAIAIAISAAAYLAFGLGLGGGQFNVWYGILPAIIALVVAYLLLARRSLKQLEVITNRAASEMGRMQEQMMARPGKNPSKKEMRERVERIIGILKEGYTLSRWQFLVEAQINSQIGVLYYSLREFDEAEPYLTNSFFKNWIAQAMLATIYFRRRKYDTMEEVFERAVKSNEKESLLWALYAWCLWKNKDRDGAIKVLNRAKQVLTDPRIESNLLALQNDKKMKMDKWDAWYQFQLERPPAAKYAQAMGGFRGSRRAVYR